MTSLAAKFRFQELHRICVIAICLVWLVTDSVLAQPPKPAKPVTVAQITQIEEVQSGQTFVGSVTPIRKVVIGSAVDGRVVKFHVDAGVRVKAQQPLAELLTATIKLELKTAESELRLRQHELEELTAGTRELEKVQLKALRDASNATKNYTEQNLKRIESLWKRGAVTELEFLDAQAKYLAALETYNETKAAYDLAVEGPRKEKKAQAAARVEMQSAIVEKLKDQITKHTIISRFDGFVTQEFTEEGAWVNRGDPVAEVVALDEVDILANVLESQVSFIHVGDPIRVEIPALPDRVFTGHIEAIVPQADPRSRTFPVKIRLQNEVSGDEPTIKAGMLARAMLPTGPLSKGLFVPKDAINLGGRTPLIYVVQQQNAKDDTGTATPVSVRLGIAYGGLIEVQGELKSGDLVVVRGNERLRPKDAVKITERIDSNDLKQTEPVAAKAAPETPQSEKTDPASAEESR